GASRGDLKGEVRPGWGPAPSAPAGSHGSQDPSTRWGASARRLPGSNRGNRGSRRCRCVTGRWTRTGRSARVCSAFWHQAAEFSGKSGGLTARSSIPSVRDSCHYDVCRQRGKMHCRHNGVVEVCGMIKSELIQKIAEENPHLYQRDVERIVSTIFDEITSAMAQGQRVELRGFGAF